MSIAASSSSETMLRHSSPGSVETCRRCRTTESWGENSWCPNCGYYPVVDGAAGEGSSWSDHLPPVQEEEVEDDRSALESIPMWFWGMLAGVLALTVGSATVRLTYPEDDGPRGTIALIQLIIGAVTMLVAHGVASRSALKNDRRLNFNDILLSWFNIWQPTIAELPGTCKRVLGMTWGCFAALTAVTIIGGIDYSAPFRTEPKETIKPMKVIGAVADAARAQVADEDPASVAEALADLQSQAGAEQGAGGPKTMKEALAELGQMDEQLQDLEGLDVDAALADIEKKTLNCFVYGVETDRRNVPKAFLFAANTRGSDQHVARILTKDLPPDEFRIIAVRLYPAVQKEPEIDTERKAVWVEPIVTCRLAYTGMTETGELKNPEFEAIVVNQRGRFESTRQDQQTTIGTL